MGIFLGVVFFAYYLTFQPNEAADILRSALGGVGDTAAKLADFVRTLVR